VREANLTIIDMKLEKPNHQWKIKWTRLSKITRHLVTYCTGYQVYMEG